MLSSSAGRQLRHFHQTPKCLAYGFGMVDQGGVSPAPWKKDSKAVKFTGSGQFIPFKGLEAGKKPMKVNLEKGKEYSWCACGHSFTQPWCDHNCNRQALTFNRPVDFVSQVDGERWICMCKQTDNRPFCDNSHLDVPLLARDHDRVQQINYKNSPVYDGVARNLGFKPRKGTF